MILVVLEGFILTFERSTKNCDVIMVRAENGFLRIQGIFLSSGGVVGDVKEPSEQGQAGIERPTFTTMYYI